MYINDRYLQFKKLTVLVFILFNLNMFNSQIANAGVVVSGRLTVNQVISMGGGFVHKISFQVVGGQVVPSGLNCANDGYVIEESDSPNTSLSLLMTAMASGRDIQVVVYDDKCASNGRIRVRDVRILRK